VVASAVSTEPPAPVETPIAVPESNSPQSLPDNEVVAPVPVIVGQSGGGATTDIEVPFDITVSEMSSLGRQALQRAVEAQSREKVTVTLVARVAENITPAQRRTLAEQRVSAVRAALEAEGIPASRVTVSWLPDPSDSGMVTDGPGMQVVGRLIIARAPASLPTRMR